MPACVTAFACVWMTRMKAHMQSDQDTVIQLQSLDVVTEAVIAGQATQIYWALQCRAFPLNLMTAKTGMRADGSVTVQRGWNIHRVGQKCAVLGVPFFLSFFFFSSHTHRQENIRIQIFAWHSRNDRAHTVRPLGTLNFALGNKKKK